MSRSCVSTSVSTSFEVGRLPSKNVSRPGPPVKRSLPEPPTSRSSKREPISVSSPP
jgi:hypothetical protein